ncbi:hypothetical protein ACMBCN_03050 [Candidatus Liberibacter asiaticus]|nr:hypothetical protein [Candidatus Regiella insecticola]
MKFNLRGNYCSGPKTKKKKTNNNNNNNNNNVNIQKEYLCWTMIRILLNK